MAGIDVGFRHGRKLVGDRTARLEVVRVKESQFADDTAIYMQHRSQAAIQQSAKDFISTTDNWGLTVNISKTKGMISDMNALHDGSTVTALDVGSESIEMVEYFPYLGSYIS